MDHLIVDSTPKGSAILAYGQSRGSRPRFVIIVATIAIVVCAIAVIAWFWINGLTIALPKNRLALAVLRPSAVSPKLDAPLRQSLPPAWRTAIETKSVFPAILGVSLDAQHKMHAFALIARTSSVATGSELRMQNEGLFRLLTDDQTNALEQTSFQSITSLYRGLRNNDVAWSLNGEALRQLGDSTYGADLVSTNEDVRGTWNGSQGTIDLPVTGTKDEGALNTPVFAVLGGNLAETTPFITSLMSQGLDIRSLATPPHLIATDPNTGTPLIIRWQQPLTLHDIQTLKSAVGDNASRDYALPDEVVLHELVPGSTTSTVPFSILWSESSSTWSLIDSELRLLGDSPADLPQDPSCAGSVLFRISDQALQRLLMTWNVPSVWRERLHSLNVNQSEDRVAICLQ
jgi:hypothetical protein